MDKEVMSYDWMKEIDKKRKSNKTYYNWYELKKEAGGHPEGILILTYALYKRYKTSLSCNQMSQGTKNKLSLIFRILYHRMQI